MFSRNRTSRGNVAVGVGGDMMILSLGSVQADHGDVSGAQATVSR